MNSFPGVLAVSVLVAVAIGWLRLRELRRSDPGWSDPAWLPAAWLLGVTSGLVVLVFGAGRLVLRDIAGGVVDTVDRNQLLLWTLPLFVPGLVPLHAMMRPLEDTANSMWLAWGQFRVAVVCLFVACLLLVEWANRGGDTGAPVMESMLVLAAPAPAGADRACLVRLAAAEGNEIRLAMPAARCQGLAKGAHIPVPVRPGLLGVRWVDGRSVAAAGAP